MAISTRSLGTCHSSAKWRRARRFTIWKMYIVLGVFLRSWVSSRARADSIVIATRSTAARLVRPSRIGISPPQITPLRWNALRPDLRASPRKKHSAKQPVGLHSISIARGLHTLSGARLLRGGWLSRLFGNIAEDGCVVKTAGVEDELLVFEGRAHVVKAKKTPWQTFSKIVYTPVMLSLSDTKARGAPVCRKCSIPRATLNPKDSVKPVH